MKPRRAPPTIVIIIDAPDDARLYVMRVMSRNVTGRLEVKAMPGLDKPVVVMPGMDRFIAAPTVARIQRDLIALLEQYRDLVSGMH